VFSVQSPGPKTPISFSIGVDLGGATEAVVASDLAGWFGGSTTAGYADFLDDGYGAVQVEVTGNTVQAIEIVNIVGLASGSYLPPSCAIKVLKKTGVRGKANKGFMFWPGVAIENQVDNAGVISSAYVTDMVGVAAGLLTAIQLHAANAVILHHASSSVTTPTPVTGLEIAPNIATQRRRMNTH
jgi:hypothetical protein